MAKAATCSTASPYNGYSWSEYHKLSLPAVGSSLFADIKDVASSTPSGTGTTGYYAHVVGRVGVQAYSNGTPEIQTGIHEEDNGAPQFYVEEVGATNPPTGPGWFTIVQGGVTYYEYYYNYNGPNVGTSYGFWIERTGTNSYEVVAPGFTSPSFNFPTSPEGIDDSTYTNEVYANSSTCPTSEFEITNPSPWNFGSFTYKASGDNPSYFDSWLNSLTDWVSSFPVTCSTGCAMVATQP